MKIYFLILASALAVGCTKQTGVEDNSNFPAPPTQSKNITAGTDNQKPASFQKYSIQEGAHFCDQRTVKAVIGSVMNFTVKFDSTAMYPSVITDYNHAYDVNKLYGFSEGSDNQLNSARIGWRWINDELQLLAYVHLNGQVLRDPISYDVPFIKAVQINTEVNCSIAVSGYEYTFNVDGVSVKTPRAINTPGFDGLQQYPYFGGTLVAPYRITINIK